MELKAAEILNQINKHLPEHPSGDIVVHRSCSGVVVESTSRLVSRKSCRGGFNSNIGKPYETVGEISRLTPIIKKIKQDYFNEVVHDKLISFEEDLSKTTYNKIQKQTSLHQQKVDELRFKNDGKTEILRNEIVKSSNRLRRSRFGYLDHSQNNEFIMTSDPGQNFKKEVVKNKAWEAIKKRERDRSLEQKLSFYDESPRTAARRMQTGHVPWGVPNMPQVPTTPENNKFYPKTRKISRTNTIISKSQIKKGKSFMDVSYLRYPNILGSIGTSLLLKILRDEQQNCNPSNEEIANFNEIATQRIAEVTKSTWKGNIKDYAVKKLLNQDVPHAADLISSFFP